MRLDYTHVVLVVTLLPLPYMSPLYPFVLRLVFVCASMWSIRIYRVFWGTVTVGSLGAFWNRFGSCCLAGGPRSASQQSGSEYRILIQVGVSGTHPTAPGSLPT